HSTEVAAAAACTFAAGLANGGTVITRRRVASQFVGRKRLRIEIARIEIAADERRRDRQHGDDDRPLLTAQRSHFAAWLRCMGCAEALRAPKAGPRRRKSLPS